ncbi:MAG TPA: chloride channel protein, partial [Methylomirabilota bacterium]|nr:chloride channel protein [Methylomirabilota bacterium]
GAFAIIGATAFVAVGMNMPITAIILTMEFTWIDLNYLVPMLFAVTGALAADRLCCPLGPTGTPPDRGYKRQASTARSCEKAPATNAVAYDSYEGR